MKDDNRHKDMINSILESVSRLDYIKPEDIPKY